MTIASQDFSDYAHTGPGTLAGRYLRLFWHPIYVARDLKAGRALPLRVMNEDLTLYRGLNGEPRMLAFRCAHRGTQLSTGWVEDDCVRCFYHGWKYDPTGQCVEAPAEREGFAETVRIKAYPVQEYLGLIFAYLGDDAPPAMPRYADFEEEGVFTVSTYLRECNWFQNLENVGDPVHVSFTHRDSEFGEHGLYVVPEVSGEESEWGVTVRARRPGEMVRITQIGMPNIANVAGSPTTDESGWEDFIAWRLPIDDTTHRSFNVHMAHVTGEAAERYREKAATRGQFKPAESGNAAAWRILRGELTWEDVQDRPDIIGIQDHVSQIGQGIIANRAAERLGQSDRVVSVLRRVWSRELRALDESQTLTQWRRTESIHAVPGAV